MEGSLLQKVLIADNHKYMFFCIALFSAIVSFIIKLRLYVEANIIAVFLLSAITFAIFAFIHELSHFMMCKVYRVDAKIVTLGMVEIDDEDIKILSKFDRIMINMFAPFVNLYFALIFSLPVVLGISLPSSAYHIFTFIAFINLLFWGMNSFPLLPLTDGHSSLILALSYVFDEEKVSYAVRHLSYLFWSVFLGAYIGWMIYRLFLG